MTLTFMVDVVVQGRHGGIKQQTPGAVEINLSQPQLLNGRHHSAAESCLGSCWAAAVDVSWLISRSPYCTSCVDPLLVELGDMLRDACW